MRISIIMTGLTIEEFLFLQGPPTNKKVILLGAENYKENGLQAVLSIESSESKQSSLAQTLRRLNKICKNQKNRIHINYEIPELNIEEALVLQKIPIFFINVIDLNGNVKAVIPQFNCYGKDKRKKYLPAIISAFIELLI